MNTIYAGVNDVLSAYFWGMVSKYGWPDRVGAPTMREIYKDLVDFDDHYKVSTHSLFLLGLKPQEMAPLALWSAYRNKNYNVVYVTTCKAGGFEEVAVAKWIRANGFPPSKLVCCSNKEEKAEYLLVNTQYRDMVIDSYRDFLTPLWEIGRPVVVALDAPWNRGARAHQRIKTWSEIVTWFVEDKLPVVCRNE